MEAEPATDSAWLTRFACPRTGRPLLVALEQATRARALLVPISKTAVPSRREWPECRGLELICVVLSSELCLGVRLRDQGCADVFTALAEDLAPRISATTSATQAAAELLGRLRRWQQFLSTAGTTISVEAQRGLWGELHVLLTHLVTGLGPATAVLGWNAGAGAHQDFQFSAGAVEVKTTAAKQPQSVRITSERQLDDTGVGALFLHVVVIDEREVAPGEVGPGSSLAAIISCLRSALSSDTASLAVFSDRLLDRGWLDAHAAKYDGRRLTLRGERTFRVEEGFPRLVERGLPPGVGDVSFAVSLAACEPFATSVPSMLRELSPKEIIKRGMPRNS